MDYKRFENKRVLITGATGLLGYNIIDHLKDVQGISIIAVGRSENKLKSTFDPINHTKSIEYFVHNLCDKFPESLGKIDFIFHAASPVSGMDIKNAPYDVISSNLFGIINCLEYCKQQKSGKVIVFSSATVYAENGGNELAEEDDTTYAENLISYNSPYSESKRMVEVIAHAYKRQYGVDVLIARFSYVYGYTPNPAKTAFYEFLFTALRGENIIMKNACLPKRDNIYVDDAVNALLMLCQIDSTNNYVYNISSNGNKDNYASAYEIAMTIAEVASERSGKSCFVKCEKEPCVLQGVKLSNAKLGKIGWSITSCLKDGISETLRKYNDDIR